MLSAHIFAHCPVLERARIALEHVTQTEVVESGNACSLHRGLGTGGEVEDGGVSEGQLREGGSELNTVTDHLGVETQSLNRRRHKVSGHLLGRSDD